MLHTRLSVGYSLRDWTRVEPAASNVPVYSRRDQDERGESDGVVHVKCGDGASGGEDEDDGYKGGPEDCPRVDEWRGFAEIPRAWFEFAPAKLAAARSSH